MSYNDELYHWGIKGMKWGIRRFQKKDGTLTALGKKRKRDDDDAPSKPKSIKDMSDAELRAETARLNLEQQYLTAKSNVERLNPRQLSMGEKFANTFKNKVVPELTNVGTRLIGQYMEKKGKELLGLSDGDSLDSLRKEVEKLKLTKQKKEITDQLNGKKKDKGDNQSKKDKNNNQQNNQSKKDKNNNQQNNQPKKDDTTVQPKKSESSSSGIGVKGDKWVKSAPAQKTSNESKSARPSLSDIANSGYRMKNTDYIENRGYDYGFKFANRTSRAVSKLSDSGYTMSKLETLSGEKKTNLGKTHLSDIINSGWKMTKLDDIETRGYRK